MGDYCSFTPTGLQNNILFVLFMQTVPYDGLREGCGWCEGHITMRIFYLVWHSGL